jgi:hypothetical protein
VDYGGRIVVASDGTFSLWTAVLRRWPLALVLVVLGAVAGAAASTLVHTTYTSEVRLAVGGSDLSAQAVPGFALASQELASNYARFVTAAPVRSALPPEEAANVLTVSASPVPESNVIRVEVTARDEASSLAAAAEAGRQLVAQVGKIVSSTGAPKTLAQYRELSRQVAEAQQRQSDAQALVDQLRSRPRSSGAGQPSLDQARQAAVDAAATLADLQVQQNALGALYQNQVGQGPSQNTLSVVSSAAVSGNDATSKAELYGLGGAALGAGLSAWAAATLERRRQRSRRRARYTLDSTGQRSAAVDPFVTRPAEWSARDGAESRQAWTARR